MTYKTLFFVVMAKNLLILLKYNVILFFATKLEMTFFCAFAKTIGFRWFCHFLSGESLSWP